MQGAIPCQRPDHARCPHVFGHMVLMHMVPLFDRKVCLQGSAPNDCRSVAMQPLACCDGTDVASEHLLPARLCAALLSCCERNESPAADGLALSPRDAHLLCCEEPDKPDHGNTLRAVPTRCGSKMVAQPTPPCMGPARRLHGTSLRQCAARTAGRCQSCAR